MLSTKPYLLAINGGSSSIKFARYDSGDYSQLIQSGRIEGIGLARGNFTVSGCAEKQLFVQPIVAPDYATAIGLIMEWLEKNADAGQLVAVGHRVVHGGPDYFEPQRLDAEMFTKLQKISALDPQHMPGELLLIEAFNKRFPDIPQIICFDTAFHRDLPAVAQRMAIPRRYSEQGIRRYGFHGLSCAFLINQLTQLAGASAAQGRVILAHLGNGASVTAVRGGKSIDTSMGFTPCSGLPMSNRSGDIDPGLANYLADTEQMTPEQFNHMVNQQSGLLGVSGTTGDMRELLLRETQDDHAAEAVALFCYHARRWICGLAGALEGVDTLVFSGGIGENVAEIRTRICAGLGFMGIELDPAQNHAHAEVISSFGSKVVVRVIRTDEELMIAQSLAHVLQQTQAD